MKFFKNFGVAAVLMLLSSSAWADVPRLINFQGVLRNDSGKVVRDSSYDITVKIYDAPIGGNELWMESQTVNTTNGLFNAFLGSSTPLPDSIFNDTLRWLGIRIGSDPEMAPRQRLVSVGYSFAFAGFNIQDSNVILADRLGGSVGIGTNSPTEKLDVVGNIKSSDTVFASAFSSTSPLKLQTNKNTRIYVDDVTGNVGIGTTTPAHKLDVNGIVNATDIYKNGAPFTGGGSQWTTVGSDIYYNSGNVGIGTATPGRVLEVFRDQGALTAMRVSNPSTADGAYAQVTVLGSSGNASGTFGVASSGATDPGILGANRVFVGADNTADGGLAVYSSHPTLGNIRFFTTGGAPGNERMRITSAGNVGIGISSPNTSLGIYNSNESTTLTNFTQSLTSSGINIVTDYTNGAYTPGLFWSTQNQNPSRPKAGVWILETNSGSDMYLGTSNDYATGITNTGLILNANGNVGIGTTSPNASLHVVGSVLPLKLERLGSGIGQDNSWTLSISNMSSGTALKSLQIRPVSSNADFAVLTSTTVDPVVPNFIVKNGGNVGIGTDSPTSPFGSSKTLTIESGGFGPSIGLKNTGTGGQFFELGSTADVAGTNPRLDIFRSGLSPAIATFAGSGNVGIGTTSPNATLHVQSTEGSIKLERLNSGIGQDNTWKFQISNSHSEISQRSLTIRPDGPGASAADFTVQTSTTSDPVVPDFVVKNGGNVGIGKASPNEKLDVAGNANFSGLYPYVSLATSSWPNVAHMQAGVNLAGGASGDYLMIHTPNAKGFTIHQGTTNRLTIDLSGNVGIGTTSPQGALDVSSTTGAFIVPRMTATQRDALTAVNGMIIYNTTDNQFNFYENGAWVTK